MDLEALIAMSQRYGADPEYVLAGGGNTSYKTADTLYVKASGVSLASINGDGFVPLSRTALSAMLVKEYPDGEKEREAACLADMMAARENGSNLRPSVEALLHGIFEYKYVLHVHPALVNGLTCGADGENAAKRLFPDAIWIPIMRPGYTLAAFCANRMAQYKRERGKAADMILLQNHGVFFAADTTEEIDSIVSGCVEKLCASLKRAPSSEKTDYSQAATEFAPTLRMAYKKCFGGGAVRFCDNKDVRELSGKSGLALPFSPDHIVYCRAFPLFAEAGDSAERLCERFGEYEKKNGCAPRMIFAGDAGVFTVGKTQKEADTALSLLCDAAKIAVCSESFGGPLHMTDDMIRFITGWEVESYRGSIAAGNGTAGRMNGKIALVTGGAQGIGGGIVRGLVENGAFVFVADINYDGAKKYAEQLCGKYGRHCAEGVSVNVADEKSVERLASDCAALYGGIDIFVNNAGIVRAGGLDEMTLANFELVTKINYEAYFLCAKYFSAVMRVQHDAAPEEFFDIIEINSKSGLEGSLRNFAYAGSKFGGIGLTQSFALELVAYNIKCNAICPGNFLDGPLWSDPEKGLFVQYLNAGKVKGAKTVADVRAYYEGKVPMKRGCRDDDVIRAVMYLVDQKYETGQALPVTGGQVMLN